MSNGPNSNGIAEDITLPPRPSAPPVADKGSSGTSGNQDERME